jgi:hypothetical protein
MHWELVSKYENKEYAGCKLLCILFRNIILAYFLGARKVMSGFNAHLSVSENWACQCMLPKYPCNKLQ